MLLLWNIPSARWQNLVSTLLNLYSLLDASFELNQSNGHHEYVECK